MKKQIISISTFFALATLGQAAVIINEALISTTSTDGEFIELYNTGPDAVDIQGWSILEYESDSGAAFGTLDDTFTIPTGAPITVAAGGYYLIGNITFITDYGITPDLTLNLTVENTSVTLALQDASLNLQYTAFLTDGGVGDAANIGGTTITPDISVGPDGSFLPAGYYLILDGGSTAGVLEFSPKPAPSATPGAANIPEPSVALLGVLGLLGLLRRRR